MRLSHTQKLEIYRDGYTHVCGAISPLMVGAARRAINASMGRGLPPEEMTRFAAQGFFPELSADPALTGLFNETPLRALVSSALGFDVAPVKNCQIALRFPTLLDPLPATGMHLDGISSLHNGIPPDQLHSFSALVGVFLSDVSQHNRGNFSVWPGSHHRFEQHFRENGVEDLTDGTPEIPLGDPVVIYAAPGDAAICHYQLGHGFMANGSPDIRYAVFFRIHHPDHAAQKWEVLKDIWRHWPSVRAAGQEAELHRKG